MMSVRCWRVISGPSSVGHWRRRVRWGTSPVGHWRARSVARPMVVLAPATLRLGKRPPSASWTRDSCCCCCCCDLSTADCPPYGVCCRCFYDFAILCVPALSCGAIDDESEMDESRELSEPWLKILRAGLSRCCCLLRTGCFLLLRCYRRSS